MADYGLDLRAVESFPSLVKYLRDELDWPIESDDVEDLTFDYEPEELELEAKAAARVKKVKQLRPLSGNQPWGIFFVEFEKKKLPVVILRLLLSHLVIKKRASANKAERAAWNVDDLLFISAFGEETTTERKMAFAHFRQEAGDVPTLRVLGWDGGDTPLKLEHVAAELKAKLHWPDDPSNRTAWREQWSNAFRHRVGHVIRTADALAETLAALARGIRNSARTLIRHETERGPLRKLHNAFQTALIHDLTEESFADTYAQTITYGLLTAAISRTDMSGGRYGTALLTEDVARIVPVTNPFLKEMLETFLKLGGRKGGIDFDQLGVQDVVDLLRGDETDLPAILRDFGNRTRGEDPVIHFYEHFLTAYDQKLKIQRGVFYTPQPVVSYIVRSVHELLQTEFGLEDGLASTVTWGEMIEHHPALTLPLLTDEAGEKRSINPKEPFVQILDLATGTATFLVECIDVIHQTITAKWKTKGLTKNERRAAWNDYVPTHLLPRLYGYELMMAPYAIAHMKLPLKLKETGFTAWDRLGEDNRARIYLTNALEPKVTQLPHIGFDALAHEAADVNEIKWYKRFTVVIGNPPYSKSMSKHPWSLALVNNFKVGLNEKKSDLNREEWKFLSFGYYCLNKASVGLLGVVINNAFVSSPTHRGLRGFLMRDTSRLMIVDLHGDSRKGETAPDGSVDENVFDIQQGVCVLLCPKDIAGNRPGKLAKADIFGTQEHKYEELTRLTSASTTFEEFSPQPPLFLFRDLKTTKLSPYAHWIPISEIFANSNTGIQTKNDSLFADISKRALSYRMEEVLTNLSKDRSAVCKKYGLVDSSGWRVSQLEEVKFDETAIHQFLYKPFDHRFVYYHTRALGRARHSTMRHMLRRNLALVATRQVTRLPFCHAFVSRWPIEEKTGSHDRTTQLFPLYLYAEGSRFEFDHGKNDVGCAKSANFTAKFAEFLRLKYGYGARVGDSETISPEHVFNYIYSILNCPSYRYEFGAELMGDFPRVPFTDNVELFRSLAGLGGELVSLHLMESGKLDRPITTYIGAKKPEVEKLWYSRGTVWLDKDQTCAFRGIPDTVWNFSVGGYQICEKWLKDRRGRTLSYEEIKHYQRIVVALNETNRLMGEIDAVIDEHGGWPLPGSLDAFKASGPDQLPFA